MDKETLDKVLPHPLSRQTSLVHGNYFEELLQGFNRVSEVGIKSGFEIGRTEERMESAKMREALGLILREYDAGKDNPDARIPSRLALAIEAARAVV